MGCLISIMLYAEVNAQCTKLTKIIASTRYCQLSTDDGR